jgi:CheY-like chemotaxis protein
VIKEGFMAGPKRILIVDDEEDIRTYLSTLLEDQGFQTVLAKDGEEAMKIIQAETPDLITLDISMPEKSGVKFFREIKTDSRWKQIPIVIVTGVSENFRNFISSRHQIPAPEGFVSKPISPEEILGLVRTLTKT